MKLVFDEPKRVADWVGERINSKIHEPYTAIGATRDGQLCAGAVFNGWNGANIDITLANDRGLSRGAIAAVYRYAFYQLKAQRVTAHTRRSNKKMRELLPRFGFVFEYTAKRFFGPNRADDAFIFALYPEKAKRFL